MNQTDALIVIVTAMYKSLGNNEQQKMVAEIKAMLTTMNRDDKTHFHNGATHVADLAEKITGVTDYKSGSGFN